MAEYLSQTEWISFVTSRDTAVCRKQPKRTEERAPASGDISLVLEDGHRPRYRAILLNISGCGLMVKADSEIPDRSLLQIELNGIGLARNAFGEVRHCTQTLGGYKIGIRLMWKTNGHPASETPMLRLASHSDYR